MDVNGESFQRQRQRARLGLDSLRRYVTLIGMAHGRATPARSTLTECAPMESCTSTVALYRDGESCSTAMGDCDVDMPSAPWRWSVAVNLRRSWSFGSSWATGRLSASHAVNCQSATQRRVLSKRVDR